MCESGPRSPLQHIAPPRIVQVATHVIGDHVENQPHIVAPQRGDKLLKLGACAKARIQLCEITYVVAMSAVPSRREKRGSVAMRNSKTVQIWHDCRRIYETKLACELQPIGRRWGSRRGVASTLRISTAKFNSAPSPRKCCNQTRPPSSPETAFF